MKKVRLSLLLGLMLTFTAVSFSQGPGYKTALGGKVGTMFGVNVKHYFSNLIALEATAGATPWSAGVVALCEFNFHIKKVPNLTVYVGVGADVGGHYGNGWGYYKGYNGHRGFGVGVDLIGGVEYTFQNIPLNLAVDLGPRASIIPGPGFDPVGYSGISVRYAFK